MKYYKFLTADNKGEYSKFDYTEYLPDGDKPGKWLPEIETLSICESGYHACKAEHLLEWINAQLFEVELAGEIVEAENKVVAQNMRILRKVETWNDKTARLFACWCARDVLPLFEDKYPDDKRPRVAIETAEQYAEGNSTLEELAASWNASWAASSAASWAASSAASWAVSSAASWAASSAASSAASWDASSWDASRAASWAKYTKHLVEMLGLESSDGL